MEGEEGVFGIGELGEADVVEFEKVASVEFVPELVFVGAVEEVGGGAAEGDLTLWRGSVDFLLWGVRGDDEVVVLDDVGWGGGGWLRRSRSLHGTGRG